MTMRQLILSALVLISCATIFALRYYSIQDIPYQTVRGSSEPNPELAELTRQHVSDIDTLLRELGEARSDATSLKPRATDETLESQAKKEDDPPRDDWKRDYARTRFDLVNTFLGRPDSVIANRLVRHVILNPMDKPMSKRDIELLEFLVQARTSSLKEPMKSYRLARFKEMVSVIEETDMEPVQTVTQVSRIRHKGKTYLYEQFLSLPHSDAMLEDLSFFGLEFLQEVTWFFQDRGLAQPSEISKVLSKAVAFKPADIRKPGRH